MKISEETGRLISTRAAEAWKKRMEEIEKHDPVAFEEFEDLPHEDQEMAYLCYVGGYMQALVDVIGPHLEWEVA